MECKNSGFWLGIGIGSVIGALAYHFSRSEKAQELKVNAKDGFDKMTKKARHFLDDTENKAMETGQKVAEKTAEEAHWVADQADVIKEKVDIYAQRTKK